VNGYAFISFDVGEALDYTDALAGHLTGAGVRVWYDRQPTEQRWDQTTAAIQASAAVVVVVTPAVERSARVQAEVDLARRLGKPVVVLLRYGTPPVGLGPAPVEPVLTGAMPGVAFVNHLRALTSHPSGVAGAHPSGVAAAPSRRRTGLIVSIVAGCVALVVCVAGAVVVALALRPEAEPPQTWQERAAAIDGIENYLVSHPDWYRVPAEGNHRDGRVTYPVDPPAGGAHNPRWQNCMGDVYQAEIAREHAMHSLEHGAVWVTYRPDLPPDQVGQLVSRVRDRPYTMMSPYPGLDRPISLQAWGYQLKVDRADDDRIDQFIDSLRLNATQEPQATCGNGITDTGSEPVAFP
jgi:hypothetical protein